MRRHEINEEYIYAIFVDTLVLLVLNSTMTEKEKTQETRQGEKMPMPPARVPVSISWQSGLILLHRVRAVAGEVSSFFQTIGGVFQCW